MTHRRTHTRRNGFTIIEVMIVLVILGLIGGIVTINLVGAADDAKVKTTEQSMQQIKSGLTLYRTQHSTYPPSETWQQALGNTFSGELDDAWGNPFAYYQTEDGRAFQLFSNGPDGIAETEDDIVVEPDHQ